MKNSYLQESFIQQLMGDTAGGLRTIQRGSDEIMDAINAITRNHHPTDLPLIVTALRMAGKGLYERLEENEQAIVNDLESASMSITVTVKAKKQGP